MRVVALGCALSLMPLTVVCAQPAPTSQASDRTHVTQLRLEHRSSRQTAGWVLFSWGGINAVGGGLVAAIEHDRAEWVAAGLVSAAFGVVNALLAPSLMDLSEARERNILREQADSNADFAAIRERERASQLGVGQTFAFNTGLDVFYIATGILVYVLGSVQSPRVAWEQGAGLTFVVQGVPLLAFDIYNWIAANERAEALAHR
ncbi:MAG TPA: hypothetical protein VFG30_21500 [Polyangiales bacterium]|nr:hypothetical protein [Polyangiales bacterium]